MYIYILYLIKQPHKISNQEKGEMGECEKSESMGKLIIIAFAFLCSFSLLTVEGHATQFYTLYIFITIL